VYIIVDSTMVNISYWNFNKRVIMTERSFFPYYTVNDDKMNMIFYPPGKKNKMRISTIRC